MDTFYEQEYFRKVTDNHNYHFQSLNVIFDILTYDGH